MLSICFILISALLTALLAVGAALALWKCLLIFVGIFLLLNILYIGWAFSTCLRVKDIEKPIEKDDSVCRRAAVSVFGLVCSYLGMDITVRGAEKLPEDRRFLLVCNHRSAFDPIVIMNRLKKHQVSCIAKPSVMKLPFIGRIAYGIGCLGIDRDNDRNALKTILTAANYLKKDVCSICIFPEGTRSKTGEMIPFQAGSFKIAQRANAPVAVVAIKGSDLVAKNAPFRRSSVLLDIIELIPADKVKAMNTQELAEYSQRLIAESLSEVGA